MRLPRVLRTLAMTKILNGLLAEVDSSLRWNDKIKDGHTQCVFYGVARMEIRDRGRAEGDYSSGGASVGCERTLCANPPCFTLVISLFLRRDKRLKARTRGC